jgi:hypothetical protein
MSMPLAPTPSQAEGVASFLTLCSRCSCRLIEECCGARASWMKRTCASEAELPRRERCTSEARHISRSAPMRSTACVHAKICVRICSGFGCHTADTQKHTPVLWRSIARSHAHPFLLALRPFTHIIYTRSAFGKCVKRQDLLIPRQF